MAQNFLAWFEIPVSDMIRAAGFYSKVFEIEIDIRNFNGQHHGIIVTAEGTSGSLVEKKNYVAGDGPVLFFRGRDDISSTLERVEANGGKIIQPRTIIRNKISEWTAVIPQTMIDNKVGYFALFLDTEGNKIGLYGNY